MRCLEEPRDLKYSIKLLMSTSAGATAVWYGNKVQSYIYRGWRDELERRGISWRSFLKVMSTLTDALERWAKDEMSWEELLSLIERAFKVETRSSLEEYLMR